MALNTFKWNYLTPLHFKGLTQHAPFIDSDRLFWQQISLRCDWDLMKKYITANVVMTSKISNTWIGSSISILRHSVIGSVHPCVSEWVHESVRPVNLVNSEQHITKNRRREFHPILVTDVSGFTNVLIRRSKVKVTMHNRRWNPQSNLSTTTWTTASQSDASQRCVSLKTRS